MSPHSFPAAAAAAAAAARAFHVSRPRSLAAAFYLSVTPVIARTPTDRATAGWLSLLARSVTARMLSSPGELSAVHDSMDDG